MDRTLKKGMNSLYKEAHVYRSKELSVRMKCEKRMSHVASNGIVNCSWSQEKIKKEKKKRETCDDEESG